MTGDYAVVLQVSGGTVDRLMASIHQNVDAQPPLPSFPHSTVLRLGDDEAIDGVKGALWAQAGVPRIELVNAADDRFFVEVGIRARYVPDAGTAPLPEFIHGNVRAEYRIDDVDRNCLGWRPGRADYLWFRVVEESVSFDGTGDPQTIDRITRQLRALLTKRFAPKPQRVSGRFRRGSMLTLNAGAGNSAVVVPVEGTGHLSSLGQVVLEGHDFAVAISAPYVLSRVQPILDHLRATFVQHLHVYSVTSVGIGPLSVDVLTVDIHYTVTLNSASAEWSAGSVFGRSAGLLTLHISGEARTQNTDYNMTFDVTQTVMVTFDAAVEGLQLAAAGPPSVDLHGQGWFGGVVEAFAEPRIRSQVAAQVQGVLSQAGGQFNLAARKIELIAQLRKIDDHADAHFEDAQFTADGMVLLGRIPLAPRRRPVVTFEKTTQGDGYTAYESWFPGGRIDKLDWSWTWTLHGGAPGSASFADRFLLRRPRGAPTRYGFFMDLTTPLPGLDGWGTVCLTLEGAQVNPYTGDLDNVVTDPKCNRFLWGLEVVTPEDVGRLMLRDWHDGSESGLVDVAGGRVSGRASNLLVVHVGEGAREDVAHVLNEGLRACERSDAGLVVLVLFRDGALGGSGRDRSDDLRSLAGKLEAPLLLNEDVGGAWSATLAIRDGSEGPAWRLISPAGGVTWLHDGPLGAEELAKALAAGLFPCPPAVAEHVGPAVDLGARFDPGDLVVAPDPGCPAPVDVFGFRDAAVAFVVPGSAASEAQLRHLSAAARGPVIAVVDGATREEAESLASAIGGDIVAMPDPRGEVAARFGVGYWPTTLRVGALGVVTGHQVGLDPDADPKAAAR